MRQSNLLLISVSLSKYWLWFLGTDSNSCLPCTKHLIVLLLMSAAGPQVLKEECGYRSQSPKLKMNTEPCYVPK